MNNNETKKRTKAEKEKIMGILGKRYGGKNRNAGVQRFNARNSESAFKKKRTKRKSAHASKRRNKRK